MTTAERGREVGDRRPVGRVTFQDVGGEEIAGSTPGPWRYLITQADPAQAVELQVNFISIDRSVGQDAATCRLQMDNVRQGQHAHAWAGAPVDWGYAPNPDTHLLSPNIVVRTYQGDGSANFDDDGFAHLPGDAEYVHPSDDESIVLTGVWLIDRVTYTGGVDGPRVVIEMRDLAKLLIEQPIYPPALPLDRFPLIYSPVPQELLRLPVLPYPKKEDHPDG